jgi:hypothetical protein
MHCSVTGESLKQFKKQVYLMSAWTGDKNIAQNAQLKWEYRAGGEAQKVRPPA